MKLKLLAFAVISMVLSFASLAEPPLAKMEAVGPNVQIVVSDFADAVGFENYKCVVDFENWEYELPASATIINNERFYVCLDQGILQQDTKYHVYFVFEDRPYSRTSQTATFTLSTG